MKQTTTNRAAQCLLLSAWLSIGTSVAAAAENSIGTEGVFYLRTSGPALEVKPFEEGGALLIRIADIARDEDISIYELRYIGYIAGEYDLRDYLRQLNGTDLSALPPANVSIVSVLPANHDGELRAIRRSPLPFAWPYRILLAGAGLLWLVPLVWWTNQRMANRKRVAKEAHTPRLSLADQLKPLVEAVLEGRGNPCEQAALERLLLSYWREKLNLNDCSSQRALASMRADPEAGALLRQVDAWLHMPPGRQEIDVPALLAPYRNITVVSSVDSFSESAEVPA